MTLQNSFPFNGSTKLKEAALIYVAEGFSIIPLHWLSAKKCSCGKSDCASPAKHPLTPHGLKDASNDPAVVKDWWKKFPKANIGVCTGQASGGLTVIDVDVAKGGDVTPLDIPITLEVETGAGFHFWLRSTQEIKNSASKLGKGIDVRGWGGYVVAPPSIHHSGRTYTFRNRDPIAEFPQCLLDQLTLDKPEPITTPEDDPQLILGYSPDMADFALEGSRNDFLTKIGGRLRRQGFSSSEIESALLASNRERCKPPLADKEVGRIARSVGRYIPTLQIDSQVEEEPDLILSDDRETDPDSQSEQDNQEPDPFPNASTREPLLGAMTADEFDAAVFPPMEMVLQGLYKGEWGLIVGVGSIGKTTLLLNICVSLACGRPFLPIVPENVQPKRILFVDFEGPDKKLQKHVRVIRKALTPAENALVGKNLNFVVEPEINGHPWRMTDLKSLQNLAAFIQKHKIDLVIIDTLSQAGGVKDENNNAEVQQKIVLPIRRMARHCDVAILFVHHEGRGKQQEGAHDMQYRGRGATALMDASRYQISATPGDKHIREIIKVVNSKNKGEGFEPVTLKLDQNTRWFAPGEAVTPPPPPPVEDLIFDVLERCTALDGMTVAEIVEMLPATPKRTIERKLAELIESGDVVKAKRGSYRAAPNPLDDSEFDTP